MDDQIVALVQERDKESLINEMEKIFLTSFPLAGFTGRFIKGRNVFSISLIHAIYHLWLDEFGLHIVFKKRFQDKKLYVVFSTEETLYVRAILILEQIEKLASIDPHVLHLARKAHAIKSQNKLHVVKD